MTKFILRFRVDYVNHTKMYTRVDVVDWKYNSVSDYIQISYTKKSKKETEIVLIENGVISNFNVVREDEV